MGSNRRLLFVFVAFATGAWDCSGGTPMQAGPADLAGAASGDLASARDLSGGAAPDLASPADLASSPDLAANPDLSMATLRWYDTCGDPVCHQGGHRTDPNIPVCTNQMVGAACTVEGQQCDPVDDCNIHLLCAASDPTKQMGGCPISNRQYKEDIDYLDDASRAALERDLLQIPLATFRYRDRPGATKRLGFIIEDVKSPFPIAEGGGRVDVYGFSSMAVAALQAQAKRIDAMQARINALEAQAKTCKPRRR